MTNKPDHVSDHVPDLVLEDGPKPEIPDWFEDSMKAIMASDLSAPSDNLENLIRRESAGPNHQSRPKT